MGLRQTETRQVSFHVARTSDKNVKQGGKGKLSLLLLGVIFIVAAFCGGFAVRGNTTLLNSLGMSSLNPQQEESTQQSEKSVYSSYAARISEVEDILNEYSVADLDVETVSSAVLSSLASATGDKYLSYFSATRYANYVAGNLLDSQTGVGILFSEYDGRAYAACVLEGSAAQIMGVSQGDYVVAINGLRQDTWTQAEVINAIAKATSVDITWLRTTSLDNFAGSEYTTTLKCTNYTVENVTYELIDSVGYIKLRQITSDSAELVADAVRALQHKGALSFVLDLRDNPGGYLEQAVDIASLFMASGIAAYVETADGINEYKVSGSPLTDAPLAVLVNTYTTSAAEVLTAALQDSERATIVGEPTVGKGSVQVMKELSFGGAIRYTAAYYMSPNKRMIDDGIIPDELQGPSDSDDEDNQKDTAVNLMMLAVI